MVLTRGVAVLGAAALLLTSPAVPHAQEKFRIRLSTVPMDGSMRSTVAGKGSATAVLTGTTLVITGTFEGLLSAATTAHLHRGIALGVRGPSVAELTVTRAAGGEISGSVDLAPELLPALQRGQIYIQIASETAPEGNLWGWLVR